jgi:hypothetical protein
MKAANIVILGLVAGALSGCGAYDYARNAVAPTPGNSVEFVSGNAASVLIDFDNGRSSELKFADAMAKDKCTLFGKPSAALESLDPRGDGEEMQATYLCH